MKIIPFIYSVSGPISGLVRLTGMLTMSDTNNSLSKRLHSPGPKRILALDGGGIRGLVTLGLLARVEKILRERLNRADLVLSDYFDLNWRNQYRVNHWHSPLYGVVC